MKPRLSPRLMALAGALVFFAAGAASGIAAQPEWKAGLASAKITPAKPLMLAGYAARTSPFNKIEDDLFAKALALEDASGNRGVIVTTDLLGFSAEVAAPIFERIREKTRLRREEIVLNSSHTHTGPTLDLNELRRGAFSAQDARNTVEYTRQLQDHIVEIVVRAVADLAPARLSWGVGLAPFAVNRREFTPGRVRLGVNPRGLVDRSVPVLRIDGSDGQLRCVLFGYACHNTTLSQTDYMLSGDYAGYAQTFVQRRHPGAQAMFMMGCGGDAAPHPRGTMEIARQHGATLGEEVCRLLETKLVAIRGPLKCVLEHADLPVRQMGRNELEKLTLTGNVREKATAARMLVSLDRGEPQPKTYPAPVAVWQFGNDLTFVALSGEVVVDYVPLIEKAIGPLQLWISAYCNDVFGYVPSARVLAEGGYETRGLFAANGLFTPDTEAVLVGKIRELSVKAGRRLPQ